MKLWKTLTRKTILNYSKFLRVEEHTIELPDGQVIDDWPWLITPDFVNVAVMTTEDKFLCFRQTKYSVEGTTLAPIGGYLEPDEEPLVAAQRELLEETGYKAPEWIYLGSYAIDGNRGAGTGYLFFARNASPVTAPNADDLEEQKLLHLSRAEVEAALIAGEFKVVSWPTVMALALLRLK